MLGSWAKTTAKAPARDCGVWGIFKAETKQKQKVMEKNAGTSKVGEWPKYDRDLGADKPKWSSGIRKMVLLGAIDETNAEMLADYLPEQLAIGAFRAEDSKDERMIEDFQSSGLGVNEFLKVWQRI